MDLEQRLEEAKRAESALANQVADHFDTGVMPPTDLVRALFIARDQIGRLRVMLRSARRRARKGGVA